MRSFHICISLNYTIASLKPPNKSIAFVWKIISQKPFVPKTLPFVTPQRRSSHLFGGLEKKRDVCR
jgi:hypothetical protein